MRRSKGAAYLLLIISLLLSIFFACRYGIAASGFSKASDTISSSRPLGPSNHLVKARVHTQIPGNGKIIIQPQSGFFVIPDGFDFSDVDMATSTDNFGEFNNLPLGPDFSDGQSVVNAATGTAGSVEIVLNPGLTIPAGIYLEIKLGTNAFYQENGDRQIVNPASQGSYLVKIYSQDDAGRYLDEKEVAIAMVDPVVMGTFREKVRFNGNPTGSLMAGTTQTIISLMTNYRADCRYAAAPGVPYPLMTETFGYTGEYYHSKLITGLLGGVWNRYYVRCYSFFDGLYDDTDYLIEFYVEGEGEDTGNGGDSGGEGGGTGEDSGAGTGSNPDIPGGTGGGADGAGAGGGQGGGSGGGGGPIPGPSQTQQEQPGEGEYPYPDQGTSEIALEGLAYPGSEVNILKDGVAVKKAKCNEAGQFKSEIKGLKEGVYTFTLWAYDSENRRSATKSLTIWIKESTKNMSRVFLAPTLALNKTAFNPGEQLIAMGQTTPENKLDAWITSLPGGKTVKKAGLADQAGKWSLTVDTKEFSNGGYQIKARAENASEGLSDFGTPLNFGVGQQAPNSSDTCSRADINKDKKVNLVDFSILLYNWGKANSPADINLDTKTNLVDFSLMMYCWTG